MTRKEIGEAVAAMELTELIAKMDILSIMLFLLVRLATMQRVIWIIEILFYGCRKHRIIQRPWLNSGPGKSRRHKMTTKQALITLLIFMATVPLLLHGWALSGAI